MLPEDVFLIRDKTTGACLYALPAGLKEETCHRNSRKQMWALANGGSGLRNIGNNECLDANAAHQEKQGIDAFFYPCVSGNLQQTWSLSHGILQWEKYCIQGSTEGKLKLEQWSDSSHKNCGDFEVHERQTVTGRGS